MITDLALLREFFRTPSITDKLNLFRALFDSQELNVDVALAMLKVIHRELGDEKTRDRSAYKRYAEVIESLRYHKAEMLQEVAEAWRKGRMAKEPEWLAGGKMK
jgi:hypothetical protein